MSVAAVKIAGALDPYFETISSSEEYLKAISDLWQQCVEDKSIRQ